MSDILKVPVIVENKPGAFQIPAIRTLTNSQPDGYTLFLANGSSVSLTPAFQKDLPYDPLKDFSFVARTANTPAVFIVSNDVPATTLQELIAYSKENPDTLNYGSAGMGTASNLKIEYIKSFSGLNATHIPYKSDAEVLQELTAGRIHFSMTTLQSAVPALKTGLARALGVSSFETNEQLPGVPGTKLIGIPELESVEPYSFYGFVAPAGVSDDVKKKLNEVINQISEMPSVKNQILNTFYMTPISESPEDFRQFTQRELNKSLKLAKILEPAQ